MLGASSRSPGFRALKGFLGGICPTRLACAQVALLLELKGGGCARWPWGLTCNTPHIKLFMSAIGHRSAMGRQQAAAMCLWRLEACTMWQYVTTCALHYDWQEHMMCGN